MRLEFYKYHGAGNDFIVLDDRENTFPSNNVRFIQHLCDRHFGIGADGLMLLQSTADTDFKMVYFNADGNESTMCGNGGRCIVKFAQHLGVIDTSTHFTAIDGAHEAHIIGSEVNLKMIDVPEVQQMGADYRLNTGSPHYVRFVNHVQQVDVYAEGKAIRNSEPFAAQGINVNFVQTETNHSLRIRTYERGVEDETLACGTGVTAAALVYGKLHHVHKVVVKAQGGDLEVTFEPEGEGFKNVWLKGPTAFVFKGEMDIPAL